MEMKESPPHFPEMHGGPPVFTGLVPGDRGTEVIPGAIVEDEARIQKKQVSQRDRGCGPGGPRGAGKKIIQDLGVQVETSLTLSSPDLPK